MVFEMEHLLFWVNTSWSPGEESNQYHAQDLLAEKTLSITLNYTNTCSKFRASSYLILWKTTKEQAEVKNRDKLEKLCSERKGGRQKSLEHYAYQADGCVLHGTYIWAIGIELYLNDIANTKHNQNRFKFQLIGLCWGLFLFKLQAYLLSDFSV